MNPNLKVHFSSKTNEWRTPDYVFNQLNDKYQFTLDPCSTDDNHKCEKYFTIKDDGLSQDWSGHRVFMNPPYGRQIKSWIEKAYEESKKTHGTIIVCLIPARTDTRYWHKFVMNASEIHLIKGRIKFGAGKKSAPFPSAIVIFECGKNGDPVFKSVEFTAPKKFKWTKKMQKIYLKKIIDMLSFTVTIGAKSK